MLSLFALFPYSIRYHSKSVKIIRRSLYINFLCSVCILSVISVFTVLHIRFINFSIEQSAFTNTVMTHFNYVLEIVLSFCACIVVYIYVYKNKYKCVNILNKLIAFWFELPKSGTNHKNVKTDCFTIEKIRLPIITLKKLKSVYVKVIEVKREINEAFQASILMTMLQCFHAIVSQSYTMYYGTISTGALSAHEIQHFLSLITFQGPEMTVYGFFTLDATLLFHVIASASMYLIVLVQLAGEEELESVYVKVIEVKREINEAFQASILMTMLQCFHAIVSQSYTMYYGTISTGALSAHEIQHFLSLITFQGPEMTVYGFFTLDATLLFHVIASASMYLIVLVQLAGEEV
ncbi:gustatory receptor 68 [Aphomia sociella]